MNRSLLCVACFSLLLAACGSDNGNGGSDDTGNGTGGNGTGGNGDATTPAQTFLFASDLNYSRSYSGENGWAQPLATPFSGTESDQQQRLVIDSALLGNALLPVPYHITDRLFDHLGTEPADLVDFVDQAVCSAGPVTLSGTGSSESIGPACVQASNGDNAEINFSGNLSWQTPNDDFELTYEFQDLAVQWRGEDFVINGAGALYSDLNWLLLAMDVHHSGTDTTYRYWVRHAYGLSISNPAIDMAAFHPDLGAMAQLAEGAFNSDNCAGGGYSNKSGMVANFGRVADAEAVFYYEFVGCDTYEIASGTSSDTNGNAVIPELHTAYASLGVDMGLSLAQLRDSESQHHQLTQENPGPVDQPAQQLDVAKLGTVGDSNDWVNYRLALSFDLSDLPAGISTIDDVVAAKLRLYQKGDELPVEAGIVQASLREWTGTPDNSVFDLEQPIVNMAGRGIVEPQPWWSTDVRALLGTAMDESRTHLQLVVGVSSFLFSEGDNARDFCLQATAECENPMVPTIDLVY